MQSKITKNSIEFLSKHWKDGAFYGYKASSDVISNLKKLGIIDQRSDDGMYFINREVYCKLTNVKQLELPKE